MTTQKSKPNRSQSKRIPDFANRRQMAKWWETHNAVDYLDDLKPTKVKFNPGNLNKFSPNLTKNINIRVKAETIEKLNLWAQKKGLGVSALARMWLNERLEQESKYQHQ